MQGNQMQKMQVPEKICAANCAEFNRLRVLFPRATLAATNVSHE
jgi:hypothetical protein